MLANAVRDQRKAQNITQSDTAKLVGIKPPYQHSKIRQKALNLIRYSMTHISINFVAWRLSTTLMH